MIQAVKGREDRRKPAGQGDVAGVWTTNSTSGAFSLAISIIPSEPSRPVVRYPCRERLGGELSGTIAEIQDGASRGKTPQDQMVEDRVRLRREETPMLTVAEKRPFDRFDPVDCPAPDLSGPGTLATPDEAALHCVGTAPPLPQTGLVT